MAEPEEISILTEIDRLAYGEPFEPFIIVMASGARYHVREEDIVAVARSTVLVARHQRGYHLLRQSQISEVSVPEEAP